jgi:DNA-3-methyladenine glycosylase II
MTDLEITPRGPFSLAAAQDFAAGFAPGIGGGGAGTLSIAMSFPLEGTDRSAAVEISQREDGVLVGRSDADAVDLPAITRQAARSLSVDHDGTDWPAVGQRDPVIGRLQQTHNYLRPVCFYSAYEAATSFVIGQRIAMRQSARIKAALSEEFGDRPTVDGHPYAAFPRPSRLLEIGEVRGLSDAKVRWLRGLAQAAVDGRLDTETIRTLPRDESLARLRELRGVGPWTAEAIRLRGCAVVDELPENDELTLRAAADLYDRPGLTRADYEVLADTWRPYRMWAVVLLRVGWNREMGRKSYRQSR